MVARTARVWGMVLLGMAWILSVSCFFDPSGFQYGSGDAAGPDSASPDAVARDAGSTDAELSDAAPPVDAANPCLSMDPPWWDLGWRRRRRIDLGIVHQDYTVLLSVIGGVQTDIESHVLGNLDDLRVVRYDGAWTELDRTVRSDASALRVRFRVREDLDGSGGEPQYFLYYDHPGAAAAPDNRKEVFLFVDYFERTDLGIGTVYEQWDANLLEPGAWWIDNGELVQYGTGALTVLTIESLAGRLGVGYRISYDWLSEDEYTDSGPVFHWDALLGTGYYLERQLYDAVLFSEADHTEYARQTMPTTADDSWRVHVVQYYNGRIDFFENGSGPQFTLPLTATGSETVGLATYCPRTAPFRFDNLSVRLYVEPEPAPTLDAEQFCAGP